MSCRLRWLLSATAAAVAVRCAAATAQCRRRCDAAGALCGFRRRLSLCAAEPRSWGSASSAAADSGSFQCRVCRRLYAHENSLRQHMKVHTGRTRCPICGRVMARVATLNEHMRTAHRELTATRAQAPAAAPGAAGGGTGSLRQPRLLETASGQLNDRRSGQTREDRVP